MSMTDPIADLLTRIRNAQMSGHESVEIPFSKVKAEIVRILRDEGYISGFKINKKEPFQTVTVALKYLGGRQPAIQVLRRVSKPGRRVYTGKDDIPPVLGKMGINILSTSRGLMTGKQARREAVGGEILCEVY